MAHRQMKRSTKKHGRKVNRMKGGSDMVSAPTTTGNMVLPQGIEYIKNAPMLLKGGMSKDATGVYGSPFFGAVPAHPMQQGGMAPYPVSIGERIDAGLAAQAGTAAIDRALAEVASLRDPNQAGGRRRKSKKSQRKSKKSQRKSKKSQRKSKKTQRKSKKTQRKSKKTQRKSKKTQRKSKKTQRKSKKSQRKSKKSYRKQRGGEMELAESYKGGIIGSDLLAKAGLHDSWKSVAAGNMM